MLTEEKQIEIRKQFGVILERMQHDWIDMLKRLETSEMMPSEYKELDNWLLVRAIVDYWCLKRPYAPLSQRTKEEVNSINPFLT